MILVVVCHPDDEVLWFGGSLHGFSQMKGCEADVICLSGKDPNSPREKEFHAAKAVAGYARGAVMGFPLRKAQQPLPYIPGTLELGLKELGRALEDVDLLITHSPFGDEHRHPHHIQAFKELLHWSKVKNIPMGFFTTVPLPIGSMRSLLRSYRRMDALHLTSWARCTYTIRDSLVAFFWYGRGWRPKYYLQWQTNLTVKTAMLECYPSVNLEQHRNGYAMYSSSVESFYLMDRKGFDIMSRILDGMQVPGPEDLFAVTPRWRLLVSATLRKLSGALHS